MKRKRRTRPEKAGHPSVTPSAAIELVAHQRLALIARYDRARERGATAIEAAKQTGQAYITVWRWKRALDSGGFASLAPRTFRCGRHGVAESAGLTPILLNRVESLALALRSVTRGFRAFARTPDCPPRLARIVRKARAIPPSLRRLIKLRPVTLAGFECDGRLVLNLPTGQPEDS